jgi:predicted dehydrogenase
LGLTSTIQLPNGLHFEWAAKALAAGKHVLLEKPSTDSADETRKLFELAASKGVTLLEAFHYRLGHWNIYIPWKVQ